MEGRKLNLYSPLPSIKRISSKTAHASESDSKKTVITKPALRSCPTKEQDTPVFVLPDQSFDHLYPASVPFVWEQIPGQPKDQMATLIQESGLLETDDEEEYEDLDTVSSSESFSVNCSTSGVSEIEKNVEKADDASSRESLDLMMSRFLPAAKAMAFTQQKHQPPYNSSEQKQTLQNREALVIRQRSRVAAEHEHFAIVQSLYDDLNNDDDEDEEDDVHHRIYPEVTIKRACGFLPRLCAKNSFKISNPVPLVSGPNRVLNHYCEQTVLPNWSTRRLSGFISPSRPWLRRTLLPPVSPRPYGVVLGQVGTEKLNQEILESTKWETMVKTSYVHNDHVRYSQDLIVHPSLDSNIHKNR